jgi:hypothetical protein
LFSNLDKFLSKSIYYIFLFILTIIIVLNIFYSAGYSSIQKDTPQFFNGITLIAASCLIALTYRNRLIMVKKMNEIYSPYLVSSLILLGVIFQLITIHLFNVNPSWDYKVLMDQSKILVSDGTLVDYFVQYPNNILIALILGFIGKLISTDLFIYQFINNALITISQYLIFRISSKVAGRGIGTISLIISVFFLPYIFYAPIVYTDTISLIFVLLPLNIIVDQKLSNKKNLIKIVMASILFAIGGLLITATRIYHPRHLFYQCSPRSLPCIANAFTNG